MLPNIMRLMRTLLVTLLVRLRDRSVFMLPNKVQESCLELMRFLGVNPMSCTRYHLDLNCGEQLGINLPLSRINVVRSRAAKEEAGFVVVAGRMPSFRKVENVHQVVCNSVQVYDRNKMTQYFIRLEIREKESSNGFLWHVF